MNSPSACARASATPAASRSSSRCIRSRRPASGPTAALDRNLAYLGLVEVLFGYPLDGVVLTTGCDKTTPAAIMAAATVEHAGDRPVRRADAQWLVEGRTRRLGHRGVVGAPGTRRRAHRLQGISRSRCLVGTIDRPLQYDGHGLDHERAGRGARLSLPGCAAIPAPYRERAQIAYETGRRAVEIVWEDLKPSDILTREAFENAIVACSAIGGSTNAPIHINAIARHVGVKL